MKLIIPFCVLVVLSLSVLGNNSTLVRGEAQDSVAYWKQKAKLAMKDAAANQKLAEKCAAENVELKRKIDQQKKI